MADIYNGDFELGNVGWIKSNEHVNIFTTYTDRIDPITGIEYPYNGSHGYGEWWIRLRHSLYKEASHSAPYELPWALCEQMIETDEGLAVKAECVLFIWNGNASQSRDIGWGRIFIQFYNDQGQPLEAIMGTGVSNPDRGIAYKPCSIETTAPAGAKSFRVGVTTYLLGASVVEADNFVLEYEYNTAFVLTSPVTGNHFDLDEEFTLAVDYDDHVPAITSVEYFANNVSLGSTSTAPFELLASLDTAGTYNIKAIGTHAGGTTTSNTNVITVGPPPDFEYKASNTYTYLVADRFVGLSRAMPATAQILGVEMFLDYDTEVLSRLTRSDTDDLSSIDTAAIWSLITGGVIEAILVEGAEGNYRKLGSTISTPITFSPENFTQTEIGESEEKRWSKYAMVTPQSATIGGETELFGLQPIQMGNFVKYGVGLRFLPTLNSVPPEFGDGDAVVRWFLDRLRLRVYFNAGTVDYYFASPDKTQVIKGRLVHYYVEDGDLETADASGNLQLQPDLVVMDGDTTWIGTDWTIHAAYPPTDDNQIGIVDEREAGSEIGMAYNGLPSQQAVVDNRSRYMFITANFYADKKLDSIYGAHGLPRAFAYNGQWFYKIYTQPDGTKDDPRHVAYHHGHLALGYDEGRIDISVVGEPYNFDGAQGASTWSIGDGVVGLLPLSGTILGIFGSKSVWGISGTTVDNFATQVISPNIGAVEYTVCDMGYPVYANAYGIYTLAQAQEYGDYLGTPMSKDVSPWLRPRLVRKYTSDKEVVVAWPVRSKNQYRLVFHDGYVLSMTLNAGNQSAPTFSFQKYNLWEEVGGEQEERIVVPAALSSQLDHTGEERIHIAPYLDMMRGIEEEEPPL